MIMGELERRSGHVDSPVAQKMNSPGEGEWLVKLFGVRTSHGGRTLRRRPPGGRDTTHIRSTPPVLLLFIFMTVQRHN